MKNCKLIKESLGGVKRDLDCTLIADHEDYQFVYYNQGSDITFVTFNIARTDKESKGFGVDFCLGNGFNVISVSQDNDTQYQSLSKEKFVEVVQPYLNGVKKVFCYGSSLGGYCALYYGSQIDSIIIAAAPKNSAHPDFKISMYEKLAFKHDIKIGLSENKAFIIYDPRRGPDREFIERLIKPSFINANYLELPFAGHAVLHYVRAVGKMRAMILGVVRNEEFIDIPKNVQTDAYLYNKAFYYYRAKMFDRSAELLLKVKDADDKVLKLKRDIESLKS